MLDRHLDATPTISISVLSGLIAIPSWPDPGQTCGCGCQCRAVASGPRKGPTGLCDGSHSADKHSPPPAGPESHRWSVSHPDLTPSSLSTLVYKRCAPTSPLGDGGKGVEADQEAQEAPAAVGNVEQQSAAPKGSTGLYRRSDSLTDTPNPSCCP